MSTKDQNSKLTRPLLIYDGDCGFCRHWIGIWQGKSEGSATSNLQGSTSETRSVDFAPYQEVGDQFPKIPKEEFEKSVFLVEPGGRISRAAEAVFRALHLGSRARLWLWLYEKVPGFKMVSEAAYALIARNRPFFSWLTHIYVRVSFPALLTAILIACVTLSLWLRFPAQVAYQHGSVPSDFTIHLQAWETASQGQDPYISKNLDYRYPPGVMALVQALPSDRSEAWVAFGSVSILLFGVALLLGARYRAWRDFFALLFGLILGWKGIIEALEHGQLEVLIFSLSVLSVFSLRNWPAISGLLGGILPWFKLGWAFFLFPLLVVLLTRKPKKLPIFFSGHFASWFIMGAAVPAMTFGSERAMALSQSWVASLRELPLSFYISDLNQGAWVSVLRWLGAGSGLERTVLALSLVALFFGVLLGKLTEKTAARGQAPMYAALGIASPWLLFVQLLIPLSWRWGSVFAVGIPFAFLDSYARRIRKWPLLSIVAVALLFWLVQLNPVAQWLGFSHWSDLHASGLITLYWLALLLMTV